MKVIEDLKEKETQFSSKKRSKLEEQHIVLRETLEGRLEAIDRELVVSLFAVF